MKINSAFFYSLFALSIAQLTISTTVFANTQAADERWFEIEVILFQQLGSKAAFKEKFSEDIDASTLPNYQKVFNLLEPKTPQDSNNIKQFLPFCTTNTNKATLFLNAIEKTSPGLDVPLAQVAIFNKADFNRARYSLNYDLQTISVDQAMLSPEALCVMTHQALSNVFNPEQLIELNIDPINNETSTNQLNDLGLYSKYPPYLIADKYLLLKDIYQRLRWSTEFKPLSHFGWRQIGVTHKKAIPLKLSAGQHLAYDYQKAFIDYQTDISNTSIQESQSNEHSATLMDEITRHQTLNKLKIDTTHNQKVLNQLFSRFESINDYSFEHDNLNEDFIRTTVNNLNQQNLDTILTNDTSDTKNKNHDLTINKPPKMPLQPWFLDGFIKVHLDHYLYITADFNVYNQNNIAITPNKDEKNPVKLINFSQNRRVISGEIHYFDHPYVGMIVQIRRFDPTKPEGEQVSQAVK